METLLLVVTVVSLALGIGVSVLGWKLLRADRLRSAARVEALQMLATGDDAPESPPEPPAAHAPHPIPAASRYATLDELDEEDPDLDREVWEVQLETDHVGAEARHADLWAGDAGPGQRRAPAARRDEARAPSPLVSDHMFGATAERGASGRRWLTLASVTAVMVAGAGLVYALHARTSGESVGREAATAGPSSTLPPIALVSLTYATDPDGTFTVTGLVQNPATGRPIRGAAAVVYLFDRDGNYFATGRAALDAAALQPGDESPFVVHVPNGGHVSRYRVGFRLPGGEVVAHIDRRGLPVDGTTDEELPTGASASRPKGAPGT